jgi:asparagine synthase (glutamine-hydrolysing)
MCGIAGLIGLTKEKITELQFSNVQKMTSCLKHRGPDSIGHYKDDYVILGNTRLSVMDVSDNAFLPMSCNEKKIWLAYNGEISNFKELKEKHLLPEKFPFKSTSDSEVIIYLYKLLGIDFLKELSGMFAFCLVDLEKEKAFLVRDFYGILPFFVYQNNTELYFASEIKALLEIPSLVPRINKEAIYHYFTLGYIPDSLTAFEDIVELRGGELLEICLKSKNIEKKIYYDLDFQENLNISEKEAISKTRELLVNSVERNLISDAPVGVALSGGVDSSAIIGIMKHLGKTKNTHSYSLKINHAGFDESSYQKIVRDYARTIHHEISVGSQEVIDTIYQQIAFADEPSANGGSIPAFLLAKEAKKEVKVLLSGEGGDEIFNAYPTIAAYQYRKIYRKTPSPIRTILRETVSMLPANYNKLSFEFKAKRFTKGSELETPDAHLFWRHVFTKEQKASLLNYQIKGKETEEFFRNIFNNPKIKNEINKLSMIDIKHFFIDDLMVKNDRTMLASSIENRFPFMDRILVDYVSKLPVKYKVQGIANLRWVEKEAMKPFLPKEIYEREGFGIEMPHAFWFLGELGIFARKYINKDFVEKTEILNWDFIENIWNKHLSGKQDFGRPIWAILNFLIWYDLYFLSKNHRHFRQ